MPTIGLLSDSHGRAATTRQAVDVLLAHGAEVLVHLGDVGTVEVLDALAVPAPAGGQIEAHVVFGNTDWDARALADYAEQIGLHVDHPAGRLTLERGEELVFCHGHEQARMDQALASGVRYLCHGHTHDRRDERQGPTRIINPGALFRAREYTVAVLEPAADRLAFYPVDGQR